MGEGVGEVRDLAGVGQWQSFSQRCKSEKGRDGPQGTTDAAPMATRFPGDGLFAQALSNLTPLAKQGQLPSYARTSDLSILAGHSQDPVSNTSQRLSGFNLVSGAGSSSGVLAPSSAAAAAAAAVAAAAAAEAASLAKQELPCVVDSLDMVPSSAHAMYAQGREAPALPAEQPLQGAAAVTCAQAPEAAASPVSGRAEAGEEEGPAAGSEPLSPRPRQRIKGLSTGRPHLPPSAPRQGSMQAQSSRSTGATSWGPSMTEGPQVNRMGTAEGVLPQPLNDFSFPDSRGLEEAARKQQLLLASRALGSCSSSSAGAPALPAAAEDGKAEAAGHEATEPAGTGQFEELAPASAEAAASQLTSQGIPDVLLQSPFAPRELVHPAPVASTSFGQVQEAEQARGARAAGLPPSGAGKHCKPRCYTSSLQSVDSGSCRGVTSDDPDTPLGLLKLTLSDNHKVASNLPSDSSSAASRPVSEGAGGAEANRGRGLVPRLANLGPPGPSSLPPCWSPLLSACSDGAQTFNMLGMERS